MSKQKIQLSDHFDYSRLIRFVLPCIGTMLFTSIYGIVDGLCVSTVSYTHLTLPTILRV